MLPALRLLRVSSPWGFACSRRVSTTAAAAAARTAKAAQARLHGRPRAKPEQRNPVNPVKPASDALGEVIRALQGRWDDDIGLAINIIGREARFSDGSGVYEIKEEDGVVTLRGAELVGTVDAPLWRFPWGVERSWVRPHSISPEDKVWAETFHRYKSERLRIWQQLCEAAAAGDAVQLANLRSDWEAGGPLDGLSQEHRAQLAAGQHLVPGTCMVHRRFGYRGIIIGQEPRCTAPATWRAQMGVARLPGGEAQPFYHCLVDERDRPGWQVTFVAEENIQLSRESYPVQNRLASVLLIRCDEVQGYRPGAVLEDILCRHRAGAPFQL